MQDSSTKPENKFVPMSEQEASTMAWSDLQKKAKLFNLDPGRKRADVEAMITGKVPPIFKKNSGLFFLSLRLDS